MSDELPDEIIDWKLLFTQAAAELADAKAGLHAAQIYQLRLSATITKQSAELAEIKRQVEFWRATAERRGDEIKRMYTEASHKEEPK